ncbi:MAG: DUF4124 domain-containing protein [Woeseiaceae bacterium]|nr:DUF4124 domain-containing protein [Woeseiaceae bacterium]
MDKRTLLLLASLVAAPVAGAAEAYRWVDEDGVVHYSDRPQEGAEEVVLPRAATTRIRPVTRNTDDDDRPADGGSFVYQNFEIRSPAAEETLWNIEGVLNVELALTPALRPGHRVQVYFDGEPRTVYQLRFPINEVWRGEHNLQAEVLDANGELLIRTQPTRFYVQQTTVSF